MSKNVYSEIQLHVVWHLKQNAAVLTGKIEEHVQSYIRRAAANEPEVFLHAIGGTDTHVHVAVRVPPTLNISTWIGRLKGGSARFINAKVANRRILIWQAGFGVVSFGTKELPWVIDYIQNQREHHYEGRIYDRLEKLEKDF